MTKIVPGLQTTDLGLYDEGDKELKLLEYLNNISMQYRDSVARHEGNLDESMTDWLNSIGNVNSQAGMDAVDTSLQSIEKEVNRTGNSGLKFKLGLANAAMKDKSTSFNHYKMAFDKVVNMYESPDGFLNPDNLKNTFNEETGQYHSNPEDIRDMIMQVESLTSGLIDPSTGGLKFANYIEKRGGKQFLDNGQKNPEWKPEMDITGDKAMSYLKYFNKTLANWAMSMDEKGIVSAEEFNFIYRQISPEQLQTLRTGILSDTNSKIASYMGKASQIDKTLMALEEKNTELIGSIMIGDDDSQVKQLLGGFMQDNPDYVPLTQYSKQELMSGYRIVTDENGAIQYGPDGELLKEEIPGSLINLYEQFEKDLIGDQISYKTMMDKAQTRNNWWGYVPYDADISGMLSGVQIDDGDDGGDTPPPLTKDLAQTIFDTFDPDIKKIWETEKKDDIFGDTNPQSEYDGNIYNQKEIYDLVKEPVNIVDKGTNTDTDNVLFQNLSKDEKTKIIADYKIAVKGNYNLSRLSPQEWYNNKMAKEVDAKEDKSTPALNTDDMVQNILDSLDYDKATVTSSDRSSIKSIIYPDKPWYSPGRATSEIISLVRKYKKAKSNPEREKIKTLIGNAIVAEKISNR